MLLRYTGIKIPRYSRSEYKQKIELHKYEKSQRKIKEMKQYIAELIRQLAE